MGNSASSSGRAVQDETVDLGFLYPQGVYSGSRDWNEAVVGQLICDRKLAPFYRPLEDYDPSWDEDQILAARKELPAADSSHSETPARNDAPSASSKLGHNKRPSTAREVPRYVEAAIYRNAVECPICFLVRSFFPTRPISMMSHDPDLSLVTSVSSVIHRISITRDVVIRLSAPSALCRSSAPNQP